jgi:hypothetical protein
MPSSLLFDFATKIITVPAPDTSLDLQFLVNEVRNAEGTLLPGMGYDKIMDAFGKQDLGGGNFVGITVILLDGWRVSFEARPGPNTVSVSVSGGNFVGEAGANPIAPTAFTQVTISQSTSAALVSSAASDTNLVYLVESLRNMHPGWGTTFFWDPNLGNDVNDGLSPTTAVKTFAAAHTLVSSGRSDVIFCRPTGGSGTTIVTETLNITKNNLKIRGPGISVKLIPSTTITPTVNITAEHIEFSGFYVETASTGSQNAISVNGDNVLIRDCWIGASQGNGISVTSSARLRLLTDVIENCVGSGLSFSDTTTQTLASKCIINDNLNGISLSGTGLADNIIENSLIYKNTAYGVTIGAGVARTTIRGGNTITNNTTANTLDLGTDTYIETPAGGASTTDIADAVWNELIDDHVTSGTTGRTLRDAKKKATLASIK